VTPTPIIKNKALKGNKRGSNIDRNNAGTAIKEPIAQTIGSD
jgi:hypothetical protein